MNPELMAAFFGILIIITAIFITVMQRMSARKISSLAVRPSLEIKREQINGRPIKIILHNSGAGAAYIEQVELAVDNLNIDRDLQPSIEKAISNLGLNGLDIISYIPSNGEIIQADQSAVLFEANPINIEEQKKISTVLPRLIFRIRYKSIYNETFMLS